MLLPPVDVTGWLWSVYAMCAAKNFLVFHFPWCFFSLLENHAKGVVHSESLVDVFRRVQANYNPSPCVMTSVVGVPVVTAFVEDRGLRTVFVNITI